MNLSSLGVPVLFFYLAALLFAFLGEIAALDVSRTEKKASYALAQAVPVNCLNRTM